MSNTTCRDHEEEAISAVEGRAFDLALQDEELLTQQGIFEDQLASGAGKVGEEIKDEGVLSGGSQRTIEELIEK